MSTSKSPLQGYQPVIHQFITVYSPRGLRVMVAEEVAQAVGLREGDIMRVEHLRPVLTGMIDILEEQRTELHLMISVLDDQLASARAQLASLPDNV